MRIHFIAIGGSAMHNLALALYYNHHSISGSDDEIYNPANERLAKAGLLPKEEGWFPERITKKLDAIILGMHARIDNPELLKAKELGIKIYSYPEFLYEHAKNKTRLVVGGSHGKTTTTSMIMHVLNHHKIDFDYMVGAQLEGFETMVRLSDAPVMVIEGDEYLSSPIDRRSKFLHYKPHVAILTGVAWDHINVFPTFKGYCEQFKSFAKSIDTNGVLFYYKPDKVLQKIAKDKTLECRTEAYEPFESRIKEGKTFIRLADGKEVPLKIFGQHNLSNLKAAYLACREIGITDAQFYKAIRQFKGAARRLQLLKKTEGSIAYQDFAHAPSKVEATINAFKEQYPKRKLVACLELHTFSSLNKKFLKEYKDTMNSADRTFVYFSEHTLKMKKLPPISKEEVKTAFNHPNITVFTDQEKFITALKRYKWNDKNLLLMSSGNFGGTNLKALAKELLS